MYFFWGGECVSASPGRARRAEVGRRGNFARNHGAAFAHRRGLGHGGLGRRVGQRACARCFVRCGPVSAAWARPRRSGSCRGPSPLVPQTRERKGRACGRRMLLGTGAGQFPCSPPWPVSRWARALSPACAPRRPPGAPEPVRPCRQSAALLSSLRAHGRRQPEHPTLARRLPPLPIKTCNA